MSSQREPSEFALAMIANVLDNPGLHPEPTDYALATLAMVLDPPVSHRDPQTTLAEEKS